MDTPGSSATEMKERLFREARREFPEFYALASAYEVEIMDGLVLGRAAVRAISIAPRDRVSRPIRLHLDRAGDHLDQVYAHTCELLRQCPTFKSLSDASRGQIESHLFNPTFT